LLIKTLLVKTVLIKTAREDYENELFNLAKAILYGRFMSNSG